MGRNEIDKLAELAGIVPDPDPYQSAPRAPRGDSVPMPDGRESWSVGPVDIRGWQDWGTLTSWDVSGYRSGSIVIAADTNGGAGQPQGLHAEVRVLGFIGSTGYLITEDAVGHDTSLPAEMSAGPLRVVLREGDVPHRIEIQARARLAGLPHSEVLASQLLAASASARFGK